MAEIGNGIQVGQDLQILCVETPHGGAWQVVYGTLNGHQFAAKIYPRHALNQNWEIGDSRILELSVHRLEDKRTVFKWERGRTVFKWERGLEHVRKDPLRRERVTMAIVHFLTTGALAEYGPVKPQCDHSSRRDSARDKRNRDIGLKIEYEH